METVTEPKRYQYGGKWRRDVREVYVVFNHARFGTLITQRFTDTEEQPRSDETRWVTIETAAAKIEGFIKSDHVANLVAVGSAATAEEALEIARKKFGMKAIAEKGKRREVAK